MSMKEKIREQIEQNLQCENLEIIDESKFHIGHGDFREDGETHFKIIISSKELNKLSRIKSHQKIYDIIAKEMKLIHALAIEIDRS